MKVICFASVLFWISAVSLGFAQTPTKPPASPTKSPSPQTPAKTPAKEPAQDEEIPAPAADALFPAVVARVNGKAILGRDLEQRIQAQLAPMGNPKWHNLREDYRQELISESLGALIGAELIYQKAVASALKATEVEIQAEFTRVAKTFASDAAMNRALADRGLDRAGLSKELERTLTIAKFVQESVAKKVVVTPAEVSQYYAQRTEEFRHPDMIRTSHILFMVPEGATAEQGRLSRQRAESILARVKKGEDFAKLAQENSMDSSASSGGDVGSTTKGQLAPEYEDAAYALPVGGISDLVRTQFGYHIIKVTDKKKAGLATLEEVRPQLAQFLKDRKTDEELNKLVENLRGQARIVLFVPVGAGQTPAKPTASSPRP